MAVHFSESKTKENLMRAFAGESQARNRYTIAAERAENLGMITIASVFRYTADQERAHAERFYDLLKELSGETIHIDGAYPVDQQDSLGILCADADNVGGHLCGISRRSGGAVSRRQFMNILSIILE